MFSFNDAKHEAIEERSRRNEERAEELNKRIGIAESQEAEKSHRAISPSSVDVQHLRGTYDGSSTTMKSLQTILNVLDPVPRKVVKFNPGMSQILSKVV